MNVEKCCMNFLFPFEDILDSFSWMTMRRCVSIPQFHFFILARFRDTNRIFGFLRLHSALQAKYAATHISLRNTMNTKSGLVPLYPITDYLGGTFRADEPANQFFLAILFLILHYKPSLLLPTYPCTT